MTKLHRNQISLFTLIIILFSASIVSCTATKQQPNPFQQSLDFEKDSDGKILSFNELNCGERVSKAIHCYRIKYSSDDLKVVGFIVLPPKQLKKHKVLIYNRGGNREFGKITQKNLKYLSYLASKGYVVLASQYRGNDGGGGKEEFGGEDINDVLNLIQIAKSLSFVDPSKIVMLGYSRGGMMSYLAIKNGADIKAAAVVGGVTDLIENGKDRPEMASLFRELIGSDRDKWRERSAVYWADQINVPVLILHGAEDWRVDVSQAKMLASKLDQAGKVHKLIIYPDGDHGLNTHRPQRNEEIFSWFSSYTK